jgi:glycosyltransferase involved in cell wall biosynthesis
MAEQDSLPLISVICANYNHAQYLEQAVVSLISQTYKNLEIILVDDGSTDNSVEVMNKLKTLDKRIVVLSYRKNRGKWFALNHAIKHSKGKLISLLDADDQALPERFERQYRCLVENKSLHNLCGFYHCFSQEEMKANETKHITKTSNELTIIPHKDVVTAAYKAFKHPGINHVVVDPVFEIAGATSLFYRWIWEYGIKFMPGDLGLRITTAEDGDHNLKMILLLQKTSVLKEKLILYRRNSTTNPAAREKN